MAASLSSCFNFGQSNHELSDFGREASERSRGQQGTVPAEEIQQHGGAPPPWNAEQKLQKGIPTYFVLQVDGGGILGIAPAVLLEKFEQGLQKRPGFENKHLRDIFSICCGTSTGAIISGMVAAEVPAEHIAGYYEKEGVQLFRGKGRTPQSFIPFLGPNSWTPLPISVPKFDRRTFQQALYEVLDNNSLVVDRVKKRGFAGTDSKPGRKPEQIAIGDPEMFNGPLLLIPAFDLCSNRTHFIRSRDPGDKPLRWNSSVQLVDAISASAFSAAMFFTKLDAPNIVWDHVSANGDVELRRGAVYNDGGQGSQNSPLGLAGVNALNVLVRNWAQNLPTQAQIVIISLGCGDKFDPKSFASTRRVWPAGEVYRYLRGQAQAEAPQLQWRAIKSLSDASMTSEGARIKVFRFNYQQISGSSAFEITDSKARQYHQMGEEMASRADFVQLMKDIADPDLDIRSWKQKPSQPVLPKAPPSKKAYLQAF